MWQRCSFPGCVALVRNAGRCSRHAGPLPRPPGRGYGTERWRRLAARIVQDNPTCETPGCHNPAAIAHHADLAGPHGPKGHDPDNLVALCHACHGRAHHDP